MGKVTRLDTNKSALTNGSRSFVLPVDERTPQARRFKDILAALVFDLGGEDRLSEAQRQLARRCAMLSVQAELLEAKAVAGEPLDLEKFGTITDRLGRTFARLGIKRRDRDALPDLHTNAARKASTKAPQ